MFGLARTSKAKPPAAALAGARDSVPTGVAGVARRAPVASRLPAAGALIGCLACCAAPASAQYNQAKVDARALQPPPQVLDRVGVDQNLNAQVPADLVFRDESGKRVRLGDYYGKRPIVLSLVYFKCPMLCTVVLNELLRTVKAMKDLNIGTDYDVLTVSFDPTETPALAAEKKANYLKQYNRLGAEEGWHFLTGDKASIEALCATVGFRYAWDETNKQYVHSSGMMILTPEGKISRYFFGTDYAPKDVKLSLVEASGNKIGSPADKVLLYCFTYNPHTGKYTFMVTRLIHVGGTLTVLGLATFMLVSFRRERRLKSEMGDPAARGFAVKDPAP